MAGLYVIANPAAGRTRSGDRLAELSAAFGGADRATIHVTTAPGEERLLASHAIAAGATTIVAVGGDGTCGNVAGAIMESGSNCRLAVLPAGTGNDFAKMLGLSGSSAEDIAALVAGGSVVRVDAARVDGRFFINSCGFGFDASVLESTRDVRWLKGDAVYVYAALRMLFGYRGLAIGTPRDEAGTRAASGTTEHLLMLTVSNGRSLGGAFTIAPEASVRDGLLDVCYVHDLSVPRRLQLFARALRGAHAGLTGVTMERSAALELSFDSPPLMEIDGELHRASARSLRVECLPGALSVVAEPGAVA